MNTDEMKQFFLELVTLIEEKALYADILYRNDSELRIAKDNKGVDTSQDSDNGIKIRAFDGEKFHERCFSGLDTEKLKKSAIELRDSIIVVNNPLNLNKSEALIKDFETTSKKNPKNILFTEKVDAVKNLHEKISEKLKKIPKSMNLRVSYLEEDEFRVFVSSEKQLSQRIVCCTLGVVPFVEAIDGSMRYHYQSNFEHGFEVMDISDDFIEQAVIFTEHVRNAGKISPGKYDCIFTPKVSGLLAHESFGHGMEADMIYKGRARAGDYIGKKIAPENVSILDEGSHKGSHGFYFFDDEGMIASPTYMIKNGIVQDPLTDMLSSSQLKCRRSANGRSESYDHKNYARMTNTYFDKGSDKHSEMLASISEGMYLHYFLGGMEDPKGWGVQIQSGLCERIKNGELTGEFFYEVAITGYLPTILNNITAVSDDLIVKGTGMCGKGHKEWVRVSEGGSHLLIKEVELS